MSRGSEGDAAHSELKWSDTPRERCLVRLVVSGYVVHVVFDPSQTEEDFKRELAQALVRCGAISEEQLALVQNMPVGSKSDYLQFLVPMSLIEAINFASQNPRQILVAYFDHRNFIAPKVTVGGEVPESNSRVILKAGGGLKEYLILDMGGSLQRSTDSLIAGLLESQQVDCEQAKALMNMRPAELDEIIQINWGGEKKLWSEYYKIERKYYANSRLLPVVEDRSPLAEYQCEESKLYYEIRGFYYANDGDRRVREFYVSCKKILNKMRFGQLSNKTGQSLDLLRQELLSDLAKLRRNPVIDSSPALFQKLETLVNKRAKEMLAVQQMAGVEKDKFRQNMRAVVRVLGQKMVPGDIIRYTLTDFLGGSSSVYAGPFYLDQVLVKVNYLGVEHTVSHRRNSPARVLVEDLIGQVLGSAGNSLIEMPGFLEGYADVVLRRESKDDMNFEPVSIDPDSWENSFAKDSKLALGGGEKPRATQEDPAAGGGEKPRATQEDPTAGGGEKPRATQEDPTAGGGEKPRATQEDPTAGGANYPVKKGRLKISIFHQQSSQTVDPEKAALVKHEIELLMQEYNTRKKQGNEELKTNFLKAMKTVLVSETDRSEVAAKCKRIDSARVQVFPRKEKNIELGELQFSEFEIQQALHGKYCAHVYKYFSRLYTQGSQDYSAGGGGPAKR